MTGIPSPLPRSTPPAAPARPGFSPASGWLARGLGLALDLLFPPRCAGCGRVDSQWCRRCRRDLEAVPVVTITRPLPPLNGLASTGLHSGMLQRAVQALKYEDARLLASPLAARQTACLKTLNWTVDMVVPVPLHTLRRAERGYNQAQLLAEALAANLMIPCAAHALIRHRNTHSQVGLTGAQRRANMQDAFRGDPNTLDGCAVLLVDDVRTTGATLAACAEAAFAAGAAAVYGLTVSAAD